MAKERTAALAVTVTVAVLVGAGLLAAAVVGPGAATASWCATPILCRG
ncbi:hypothetical protein [Catenuloplanes indicus]|uniref:Uncharacterized protein YhdP n=1 Tax=Catenuloplanes indicus TaxID=137267 RepID=A0AAE3VWT8_9ACTN|nr:hypothetical protein [Catenuloplanes indicus]MDQ0365052.1 uncharacterized protein YhdP [Catenuloplanes indicus]